MPVNPTMVVGVGEAGCKMASDLYDELETWNEGGDGLADFTFVGIDTRPEDLDAYTKEDFNTIKLENPEDEFEKDHGRFDYLRESIELEPGGGATRQRAASRYYVERNYDTLWDRLSTLVDSLEERDATGSRESQSNPIIWVVNSFGGGTGSGAFPLLGAMLSEMSAAETKVMGIGSLPRLEKLRSDPAPPPDDPTLYANAYAALRELSILTDYEFKEGTDTDYRTARPADATIRLPFYSDHRNLTVDAFEYDEPFFEFYGLMAIPEDASDLRELNQIAANTILYFSEAGGREDFGSALPDQGNDVLYALDSTGAKVPVDELDDYVDTRNKLDAQVSQRESVYREINRLRLSRDTLNYLTDVEPGQSPAEMPEIQPRLYLPETGEHVERLPWGGDDSRAWEDGDDDAESPLSATEMGVDFEGGWDTLRSIHDTASRRAEGYPLSRVKEEVLDSEVEKLLDRINTLPSGFEFDETTVAKYFFYLELTKRYRTRRAESEFPDLVDDAWAEHRDRIAEWGEMSVDVVSLDEADVETQWEEALDPYYGKWIKSLEARLENLSKLFDRSERQEVQATLNEVQSDYRDLSREYSNYADVNYVLELLQPRKENARTTLDDSRREIERTLQNELVPERERLDERVSQFESSLERSESRLSEMDYKDRFMAIPFEEFKQMTGGVLDDASSIIDLEQRDVIRPRDIVTAVATKIDDLDEQIQDRSNYPVDDHMSMFFGALVSDGNEAVFEGTYDEEVAGNGVRQRMQQASEHDIVNLDHPFYVRMVGLFKDARLENTSEFGTIHNLYRSGETVSKQFGKDIDDEEFVTSRFAYPELFDGDDRIAAYFGVDGSEAEADD